MRPDSFRHLLKLTARLSVLRGAGIVFAFIHSVLLARAFGAESFGQWMLVVGFVGLLGQFVRLGLDEAALIIASRSLGQGDRGKAQDVTMLSLASVTVLGLIPIGIIFLSPEFFASFLGDAHMATLLVVYSLSLIINGVLSQLVGWLRANQMVLPAAFLGDILPVLLQVLVLIAIITESNAYSIQYFTMVALLAQILSVAILGNTIARKAPLRWRIGRWSSVWLDIWKVTPSFYVIALVGAFNGWLSVCLVSQVSTASTVAHFSVALRLSTTLAIFYGLVNYIVVPRLATLHAMGDFDAFRQQFYRGLWLTGTVTFPLVAMLLGFADSIMAAWGRDFAEASNLLRVLLLGELANVATGNCGYALSASGHQGLMRRLYIFFGMGAMVISVPLVFFYGVTGAAWAVAIRTVIENAVKATSAWRILGLRPIFPERRRVGVET